MHHHSLHPITISTHTITITTHLITITTHLITITPLTFADPHKRKTVLTQNNFWLRTNSPLYDLGYVFQQVRDTNPFLTTTMTPTPSSLRQ